MWFEDDGGESERGMGWFAGQDTMHGSIADTNYYMRESFDHTAAFLTPIALITSADALGHAHKLTDDGSAERERVEVAKLAVCESSSFASLTFRCAPISCPGQVVLMQKTALLLSDNALRLRRLSDSSAVGGGARLRHEGEPGLAFRVDQGRCAAVVHGLREEDRADPSE